MQTKKQDLTNKIKHFIEEYPGSKTKRGRVGNGVAHTLTCGDGNAVITENVRIRKLTPRECLRLMGWKDEQIDKIVAAKISGTQQYRQAGNGIVARSWTGNRHGRQRHPLRIH